VINLFPNYKSNTYLINRPNNYYAIIAFLKTVDQKWDEEQWDLFADEYIKLL